MYVTKYVCGRAVNLNPPVHTRAREPSLVSEILLFTLFLDQGKEGSGFSYTIFARSDAAATIYFIAQFCAASVREQRLIESSVY